jgi:hypothetical protein
MVTSVLAEEKGRLAQQLAGAQDAFALAKHAEETARTQHREEIRKAVKENQLVEPYALTYSTAPIAHPYHPLVLT